MTGGSGGARTRAERRAAQHNTKYKTELCKNWIERGTCPYGSKCQFAHGPSEMRAREHKQTYKTRPCQAFAETGSCTYGPRCKYRHGDDDEQRLLLQDEMQVDPFVCREARNTVPAVMLVGAAGAQQPERRVGGGGGRDRIKGERRATADLSLNALHPSLALPGACGAVLSPISSSASAASSAALSHAYAGAATTPPVTPPAVAAQVGLHGAPTQHAQVVGAMAAGSIAPHAAQHVIALAALPPHSVRPHAPPPPPPPPPPMGHPHAALHSVAPHAAPIKTAFVHGATVTATTVAAAMASDSANEESPRDVDAVLDAVPSAERGLPPPHPYRLSVRSESIEADLKNEDTFGAPVRAPALPPPLPSAFLPPLLGGAGGTGAGDALGVPTDRVQPPHPAPAAGMPPPAPSLRRDVAAAAAAARAADVGGMAQLGSSMASAQPPLPSILGRNPSRSAEELVHLLARTQSAIGAELGVPAMPPPPSMARTESDFSVKGVGAIEADGVDTSPPTFGHADSEVVLSFADYYRKALADQTVDGSPVSDKIANQLNRVLIDDGGTALASNA